MGEGELREDFLGEMTFMLLLEEFTRQEGPEMGHGRWLGLREG